MTLGLAGNFNGNSMDDFVYQNGTMLGNDATDREIHFFGQSCKHVEHYEQSIDSLVPRLLPLFNTKRQG